MPPTLETSKTNSLLVPLAIVVAGAMIAGAVYFGGSKSSLKPSPTSNEAAEVEPISAGDHILGDPKAPVIVIEYSDLECPFCKVFHSTMHQIYTEYGGKVAWIYRQFPIAQLHSKAIKESEASECAYDQGGNTAFWKYIDRVFELTDSNNSLDLTLLPQIASDLGLDVTTFNSCLNTGKFTEKISKDVEKAVLAGARGTPYSVILTKDGKQIPINGAEPIEEVRIKINGALK